MQYKVAISDGFLTAFAALPKQIQGKTTEFVNKFKNNPLSPGINLEPIMGAADKKLMSVRVDQTYRGVVAREDHDKVFLLLWVDHHDKAYEWAARKKIEVNPQTGNLQVYEVNAVAPETPAIAAVSTPLFVKLSDDQLQLLGVPLEQLEYIRSLTSMEAFFQSRGIIPEDCYEHLEWIVNDFPFEEVMVLVNENRGTAAQAHDMESALLTPESQKSFVIVEGEDELRRMLAEPLEKWRIFLHPSQRKVVSRRFNGPARVLGGAGTGKTVVAIHRAKHLLKTLPENQSIFFTTFTTNLAADIQDNLRKICSVEEMRRIEVVNLDAWVLRFLREQGFPTSLIYSDQLDETWEEALALSGVNLGLDARFFAEEWTRVLANQGDFSKDSYLFASRIGRGTRLDRGKRLQVWRVFEEFQNLLREKKTRDIDTALYDCRKLLEKRYPDGLFQSVIVDEGQDFSNNAYRLLRAIAGPEHQNDLFIVGDAHQRIYKRKATLSKSNVHIRGRSSYLRINYRTTEEIRKHAFALLKGISFDDLDDAYDDGKLCQSLTHGPKPEVNVFKDANAEYEFLINHLRELEERGIDLRSVCVIARTGKILDEYKAQMTQAGFRVYEIKRSKSDDRTFEGVRLATMHRVKGLEFSYVFIVAANDRIVPLISAIDASDEVSREESLTAERCLLYVSITRAQREAFISGYGKLSEFLL